MAERELTEPVALCTSNGKLSDAAVGWSRRALHRLNLTGHWPRKKRWNYWAVMSDTHLFSVTLSNLDYLGLAFVYYVDFATGRIIEETVTRPLGRGCDLPDEVDAPIRFADKRMNFAVEMDAPGRSRIRVESESFGGTSLNALIQVDRPPSHETLNVVIPWSRNRFQFTAKHEALPAAGAVKLGEERILFEQGKAYACLDFGRGVWPYATTWNWAAFAGASAGHTVGANLGGRWTDGTGMTENALVVDGRLTKISSDLVFTYDRRDFKRPWHIRTKGTAEADLRFEPFFERVATTNALVLKSEGHQCFGRFYGTVTAEGGAPIPVDGLPGWAEEHRARW